MGGGILINYLKHKDEWLDFDERLKQSLKDEISPVTFNKNGLGYRFEDGKIKGERKTYPYFNEIHSDKFLNEVLQYQDQNSDSVASLLQKDNIEIRIELKFV